MLPFQFTSGRGLAIIKLHGREAAEEWLTGLRAFGKVYSNNMVALKAVENGEVATVLVNNYYWFALKKEKTNLDSQLHYFTDGDAGGLITVSSAAALKSTASTLAPCSARPRTS